MWFSTGLPSRSKDPETRSGSLSGASDLAGRGALPSAQGALLLPPWPSPASYSVAMTLARVNVAWQSWPGAPGVSTFYLDPTPAQATIDSIRTFFNALIALLPSGLTINVPSSGDEISEATGDITGSWSVATTPTTVTGTGAGNYAGNAGAVVHWLTQGVVANRRVRGRTFIVPLVSTAYDTAGSLGSATITTINGAASTFIAANPGLVNVWSRPRPGLSGSQNAITSTRVPDLAVSLRSRRV